MSQVARVENFEKITYFDPPGQPLPAKALMGPRGHRCGLAPPNFWFLAKIH